MAFFTALLCLVPLVVPYWVEWQLDVDIWYRAGEFIRLRPETLYDAPPGVWAYLSPPSFAAVWSPLTLASREVAYGIWWMVLSASVAASVWVVIRLVGTSWWLAGFVPPLLLTLRNGQVDAIVFALVGGMVLALREDRNRTGAALLAVAIHLKVYPLALVPVLWVAGYRRAALLAVGWLFALGVIPLVWLSPTEFAQLYVDHVYTLLTAGPWGRTLAALVPLSLIRVLSILMYALVLWDTAWKGDFLRGVAFALTAIVLTSPVLFEHSLLIMALPVAATIRSRPTYAVTAVALFLATTLLFPRPAPLRLTWVIAAMVLWWLLFVPDVLHRPERATDATERRLK